MTVKKSLRNIFPVLDKMRNHPRMPGALDRILHHPYLWYFNRHLVARATAIGLFWAFIPVPFQMVFSGFTAFFLRANLPVAVVLVWISNPLTIPPLVYLCYLIGQAVLNTRPADDYTWSLDAVWVFVENNWAPFLVGCLIAACASALIGYFIARALWGIAVRLKHRRRGKSVGKPS